MSDDKKQKDILKEIKGLGDLADGLSGMDDILSDPFGEEDMSALLGENGDLEGMPGGMAFGSFGMPTMPGMAGMPTMPGMPGMTGMAGMPKEAALYDTVIVHGFRGDYVLTFEETEEGLVITAKDRGEE